MVFIFTKHAKMKMGLLGYTVEEIKEAVIKGKKMGPDSRGNMHSRFGMVEVVFRRVEKDFVIITLFEVR